MNTTRHSSRDSARYRTRDERRKEKRKINRNKEIDSSSKRFWWKRSTNFTTFRKRLWR